MPLPFLYEFNELSKEEERILDAIDEQMAPWLARDRQRRAKARARQRAYLARKKAAAAEAARQATECGERGTAE
jgi:hypothetical protein